MVHGSLFNKAGEICIMIAGLVDCRSRVNKLSVSEDRISKNDRFAGSIDRVLPIYSHIARYRDQIHQHQLGSSKVSKMSLDI